MNPAVVTKGIILVGVLSLVACGADSTEGSSPAKNASAAAGSGVSGTNSPTSGSSGATEDPTGAADSAQGDPALASALPQTVFIPLLNWSFEMASPDCNGWTVSGGDDGIRAIPARTGDYSCKVCSSGDGTLGVSQQLGAVGKGHYNLSAYVRKRDATAAPPQALATVNATGVYGTVMQQVAPAVDVVDTEWQRVNVDIELTEDASNVEVTVGSADAQTGDCLFVDDVVFTQSL